MIISHKHRYIFFAVPKTGTHSIRRALRESMGPEDLEQVGLFEKKKFPFPQLQNIPHGHISAREIAPVIGQEMFASYFKFAFVRNPYDRFVSYCAFIGREDPAFKADPLRYMIGIARDNPPLDHLLFWPQSAFLVDQSGKLAMDLVGRNEDMQASYDRICAKIGLPKTELERANASQHRPYQEYYSDELRLWVSRLYKQDLERFGYQFDSHATQPA